MDVMLAPTDAMGRYLVRVNEWAAIVQRTGRSARVPTGQDGTQLTVAQSDVDFLVAALEQAVAHRLHHDHTASGAFHRHTAVAARDWTAAEDGVARTVTITGKWIVSQVGDGLVQIEVPHEQIPPLLAALAPRCAEPRG